MGAVGITVRRCREAHILLSKLLALLNFGKNRVYHTQRPYLVTQSDPWRHVHVGRGSCWGSNHLWRAQQWQVLLDQLAAPITRKQMHTRDHIHIIVHICLYTMTHLCIFTTTFISTLRFSNTSLIKATASCCHLPPTWRNRGAKVELFHFDSIVFQKNIVISLSF